ncbi:EamA family transporter [Oceanospirillum linum]|uniref:EamA family transporter n=1 Tax=Oceanospirillum linum TaxID=966 RepID=A0A1T1HAI4_OCELI|nr:EamA family transporter [Oceanospirillum linum]
MNRQGLNQYQGRLPIPEFSLLLVAFFWGTSYGVTKEALVFTSALAFIAIRFSLTSVMLLPMFLREMHQGRTGDFYRALPTGLILLAIFLAETYGIFHTSASRAAFLISLCILITPFIEAIVKHQRPEPLILGCALLSLFGVYLLTQTGHEGTPDSSFSLNQGDLLILLAAFLRAVMVVTTERLSKNSALSAISTTSIQSNVVAVGALIIFAFSDDPVTQLIPQSVTFWLAAFYLAFFCTLFALFAQNYGVRHTSSSRVALLTGSEPAFGALFAIIWLGESLSSIQIIGGGLILLASYLAGRRQH